MNKAIRVLENMTSNERKTITAVLGELSDDVVQCQMSFD